MFDGGDLLGWITGLTVLTLCYLHAISRPVPDILNPDEPLPVGEPPELE